MKEEKRYLGLTLALGLGLVVLLGFVGGTRPPAALAQSGTGIIRVATSGDDVPGCGSEAAPCRSVQYAVDEALPGEQIRVAAGLYTGVQARPAPPDYDGPAVITQVVYLSKTLSLQGGYTLTNWTEPDPEANPTTLDAQGQGRVMVVSDAITPTVKGLRLTGGDATGLGGGRWGRDGGGAVYAYQAEATISDCVVISNTASTAGDGCGGGLYLDNSAATLQGNTVQGNTASTTGFGCGGGLYLTADDSKGGRLYLAEGNDMLRGNRVQGNTASTADDGHGGGLYLYNSDAILEGNVVISNTASTAKAGDGGGLYLTFSDAMLQGNRVQGNTASIASTVGSNYGGGLYLCYSNATLEGNVVISNTASTADYSYGGGLWVFESNTIVLINNLVAGNQATTAGDGLGFEGTSSASLYGRLLHNTIADNTAIDDSGQGVYVGEYITLALTNTIIAGHDGVGITVTADSTAILEGTLWHGNGADTGGAGTILSGTVNVYDDPAFVNPATGDYHLGPGSAAINAGIDAGISTDIDSDPRPLGPGFDIGADEYFTASLQLAPDRSASVDPGAAITYTHILTNAGILSDTFALTLASSQDWATLLTTSPITLAPAATATIQVRVVVPAGTLSGTVDTTVLTATSQADPRLHAAVTDTTTVGGARWTVYLPLAVKGHSD
jgi:hypothetical protein